MTLKAAPVAEIYRELRANYAGSQKQQFDAEHYFFRFYRPLSFPLTAILIRLGASANAVTAVGCILLLLAAVLLATGQLLSGALLYLLAYVLDFVDGNIARYTGKPSLFGKMIDGLVDSATFLLFIALAMGNVAQGLQLFSPGTELLLGLMTAFGFLFRAYFHIRVAFVLAGAPAPGQTNEGQSPAQTAPEAAPHPGVLQLGKKIHFGVISGMPVLLLAAVLSKLASLYLVLYFTVFVVLTAFEVSYWLMRIHARDR